MSILVLLILGFIFNVCIRFHFRYSLIIYNIINSLIGLLIAKAIIKGIICKYKYILDFYLRSPKRELPIYKCEKCNKMKIGKNSLY